MEKSIEIFDFDDIRLLPGKGIVDSRDECSCKVKFGKYEFNSPVIPANMLSTVNERICQDLAENGYFYIYHRFNNDTIQFIENMNKKSLITSISLGVKQD